MGRLKKIREDKDNIRDIDFCTECGDDLNNFDLTKTEKEEIRNNFERCRKSGKFRGEFCSKIYIDDESFTDDEEED